MINQLNTVGLLLIRDRKLLLAFSNNKKCYYLPGGKIDENESAKQALCREIKEELNVRIREVDLTFYSHITAPAFGERDGVIMEQDCFLVSTNIDPHPSAEIGTIKYFDLPAYLQEKSIAPGAVMILEQLTNDDNIG